MPLSQNCKYLGTAKGITEVLENSKQSLDKLTTSIGEQISSISEKDCF